MTIEIRLFGFGEDRPTAFGNSNRLQLDIPTPATPSSVLQAVGVTDTAGLVLMDCDSVIPNHLWNDRIIEDSARLTFLSAFEGG